MTLIGLAHKPPEEVLSIIDANVFRLHGEYREKYAALTIGHDNHLSMLRQRYGIIVAMSGKVKLAGRNYGTGRDGRAK
ncbi:MAG TPA: hypothetical protein DHU81_14720 [Hyphomonas sp.]|jgi:hypothetical protein|uniref:hypothetical protein n=1 Tax=unclassified Hyphomonas TaxID=2630699 RepID=UPI000ECBD4E1|nr:MULTISPECIES: hypothetical protein [unclassified Hyphomonas]HCX11560.1 hypothetical protein [Hyphomonas sp.]